MRKKMLITTFIIAGIVVTGRIHSVCAETVFPTDMITASQDALLAMHEKSNRVYMKLKNREIKIVSYFHQREIGQAIVEKDFIRYQFDIDTGELIENTVQWRSGLPAQLPRVISQEQAESMAEGMVQFSKLYIISPESNVYPIKPTPKNPCWVVRSIDGEGMIITIIDAITGEKLGYGVPPPATGYSLSGPQPEDVTDCDDPWNNWYVNAWLWFTAMGYPTTAHEFPRTATIQSYVQNDDTAMFYEIAHGNSYGFRNWCPEYTTADDVESWLWRDEYANIAFTFLGSCDGMCDTGADTLSREFRKGSNVDTVTVGYCGMSEPQCHSCWDYAVDWQGVLFDYMQQGYTVGYAFDRANLAYPDCAGANNCMRIAGDTGLMVVPVVTRSLCGNVYNGYKGPLTLNSRDYYIRCDITVPAGDTLTIDPGVELIFMNNSKVGSYGTLNANGATGQIRFLSEQHRDKGMKFTGQLRIMNGGQIKIIW